MVHTVGIVGINGNVGKPATQALVKAAEQGKIDLVIFHRQGNSGDFKTGNNVELRVIDFDAPTEKLLETVKGVNTWISAVGVAGLASEANILDALVKSPDFVTYMPPNYSTTWNQENVEDPALKPVWSFMVGWQKAKDLKIPTTVIYTGVFDFTYFEQGFLGAPLKENYITANEKMLKNSLPLTTMEHLAWAITQVAIQDPQTIKNKNFSAVTFWPTGEELCDLYTKLNGKEAHVKDWTKADREAWRADMANYGPPRVGYWDKWANDSWEYESDGRMLLKGYEGPSLVEVAKKFL